MYRDGAEYYCTHWWYDSEDNDYEVTAIWKFEKNYPEMPDYWYLIDVDFDADLDSDVVREYIESQGPDLNDMREVDYV